MRLLSRVLRLLLRLAVASMLLVFHAPLEASTFQGPPVIPTMTDPMSVTTADLNRDGKPDLIYVDGPSRTQSAVHILLNNGNGTFTHAQDIALPSGVCCALTIADVTGDGIPDLLLVGNNNVSLILAVYAGRGDGTFQPPVLTTYNPSGFDGFAGFPCPMGIADINGDGKTDVVLLDGSSLDLLFGNGSGGFTYEQSIQSSVNASTLDLFYFVDLNGDGHPDILLTDPIGGGFDVFLAAGNGAFSSATHYSANTAAGPFLLADVDGDGHPDVLTVYYASSQPYQLGYFKGNPDGTFSTLNPLGASPIQSQPLVSAADVNGDGIPDLIFSTPSGVAVSLGKNAPAFGTPITTISGGSMSPYTTLPTMPIVADFNGDGHSDIAMAVEGGIVLLFGNGDGTFASDHFYDMGQPVGSAAVAKFSSSGNIDIAVTLPATLPRLLLGDGKGSFTLGPDPNPSYGTVIAHPTISAADFNGDGLPDVSIGNLLPNQSAAPSTPPQSVAFNQGNGVFATPISVPDGSPVMADFNGDGRMDMVTLSGGQIVVSLGQPNNSFTTVSTPLRLASTGLFNVGDVNGDGKPDLVLNYRNHLEIWLGNGDGTFTYSNSVILSGVSSGAVTVGDVDGDHNADIVLSPEADVEALLGPVAILYGNGNGTFQAPVFLPTTRRFYDVVVADVNGDNLPDLVMTDGATVAVILNLGNRSFAAETDYVAGRSIAGLNVVDVNSDGYPDIVVANGDGYVNVEGPDFSGSTVVLLLNEPNASGGAPVRGTLSVAPSSPLSGQSITMTLQVSGQSSGSSPPTGSVSFAVDGVFLADGTIASGSASFTYTGTLLPTSHTISAIYNGDATYAPMRFSAAFTVLPPTYSTSTALTASPSTLLASNTVRLTATVTSAIPIPAGPVTFMDGGAAIGSANINSAGTAYFDTNLLTPGVHNVSATFQGYTQDSSAGTTQSYSAAIFSPSTSGLAPVTITADAATVSLSLSGTSATAGTVVTFTAQVASTTGVPFGSASFYDGNTLLGTLSLDAEGQAAFRTASLTIGTHSITANFNANGPYGGSVSAPQSISVNAAPANAIATSVSLALQMDGAPDDWSLQAAVSPADPSLAGTVIFLDSGKLLGQATLDSSGSAVLPLVGFGGDTHSLTASFGGASPLAPSVSPVSIEQWPASGPGFSLRVAEAGNRAAPAAEIVLQINAIPMGDFQQPVELSCTNSLPQGYKCTFSPSVLSDGSGSSRLAISPAEKSGSRETWNQYGSGVILLFALLLWFAGLNQGRARIVTLLLGCSVIGSLSACSTKPGRATRWVIVTVQGSSANGSETIIHSAQIRIPLPTE